MIVKVRATTVQEMDIDHCEAFRILCQTLDMNCLTIEVSCLRRFAILQTCWDRSDIYECRRGHHQVTRKCDRF